MSFFRRREGDCPERVHCTSSVLVRGKRGGAIDNLARLHPDEFVGHAFEEPRLMGHQKDRLPRVAHGLQQSDHLACRVHIYVREWLVQQQNLWIMEDGPRQRHALPHSLRILPDRPRQCWVEPHRLNRCAAATIASDPVQSGEVAEILHAAHLVVEQRGMRHVANVAAGGSRSFAQDRNLAAGGMSKSGERAQQCGLPCSVVAENRVESSCVELGRDAAQRGEAPELLDDVADGDDGCGGVSHGLVWVM